MERRLSAVFAADMVGYSRLMEADEVGTLDRQKYHREKLIDPAIEQYHGRIVKEMGDGILVEFPSVVEAVQCAVKIQRAMPEREADTAENVKISYRVGINLGDIIVEGDDIYGDGVNVAARLEKLADPGGICISGTAFDQVRSSVKVGYRSLGEIRVRNIERPIRAYKVLIDPDQSGTLVKARRPLKVLLLRVLAVVSLVLMISVGVLGWRMVNNPDFQPADPNKYRFKIPEQPSLAALPFTNMTGDPGLAHIGESLADNIFVELSAAKDIVVAPKVSLSGDETQNVQSIAEKEGVRYVLMGSVQQYGDRLRIIAQLADAVAGRQVWAERYDYDGGDLLAIQDDLTVKVLSELQSNLTVGSQARYWRKVWGQVEYYRLILGGYLAMKRGNAEGLRDLEQNWLKLYELRPSEPYTNRQMAAMYMIKAVYGVIGIVPFDASNWEIARKYLLKATEFESGGPPGGHFRLMSVIDYWQGHRDLALADADKALELAPTDANVVIDAGSIKLFSGHVDEGYQLIRRGISMEPTFPYYAALNLANAHAMRGEYDEARSVGDELLTIEENEFIKRQTFGLLITAATFQGDISAARDYARRLLDLSPNITVAHFAKVRQFEADRQFVEAFLDALRKAGIPEGTSDIGP